MLTSAKSGGRWYYNEFFSEAKYAFVITCQIQTGGGGGKPSSYPYLKKNPKKPTQIRVNLQYKFKVYCREYGQYLIQFDAHEISAMGLEVRAFKNSNKWTPAFKDY